MKVQVAEMNNFQLENVNIKQENISTELPSLIKIERLESELENKTFPPLLHINKVKIEPEDHELINNISTRIEEIREVFASDYFVKQSDLINIKQEVIDDVETPIKTEVLSEECDLPVKSESEFLDLPCSSKQFETLELSKNSSDQKKRKKRYPCPICRKNLKSKLSRKKHVSIHHMLIHQDAKPFQCDICLRQFVRKHIFIEHCRIHTGEKPFKCEFCSKDFRQKYKLKLHQRIHTGEKLFSCDICLKKFTEKSVLTKHLFIHQNNKPIKCELCPKQFIDKKKLEYHSRVHTSIRHFKCHICSQGFIWKHNLNDHMKIHNEEKPFDCEICQKAFARKSTLKNHYRTHTKEKPYGCEICLKQYAHRTSLMTHLKTHE